MLRVNGRQGRAGRPWRSACATRRPSASRSPSGVNEGDHPAGRRRAGDHAGHAACKLRDAGDRRSAAAEAAVMFISDFAIKRPVITIVTMLALVVFGIFALTQLEDRRVPGRAAPGRRRLDAVSGRVARQRRARGDRADRGRRSPASAASTRSTSNSLDGFGVDHRRSSSSRRTCRRRRRRSATRSPRSATTCRRRWRSRSSRGSIRPTCRSCRWRCRRQTLTGPELTRLADPDITRRLRGIPGVARGEGGRRHRARADRRAPAARAAGAGVSVAQVVQALQAQNLAAPVGRLNGELDERTIRLRGRLEKPADFAQLRSRSRNGRVVRLGDVADVTTAPRSRAPRRSTTARKRSASTSRSRRATARPRSPTTIREKVERDPDDAAAGRRRCASCATPARASTHSVAQRRGGAGRGRGAHGARRVPVPELVALDGHHRPGAAGVGAGVVRRGAGRSASR